MVQVRALYPTNSDGSVDIDAWLERIHQRVTLSSPEILREACEWALQLEQDAVAAENIWAEGANSYTTGLEMAEILAELKLDQDSLVAAVIYRAVRERKTDLPAVARRFGEVVAGLVDGVQRMAAISVSQNPSKAAAFSSQSQVENLRKMLVTMVDDVRVALIKLAERTCAIRAVKDAPEENATASRARYSTSTHLWPIDSVSVTSNGSSRICHSDISSPCSTSRSPSCSMSVDWIGRNISTR